MNQEMFEWSLRFESHKQEDVLGGSQRKQLESKGIITLKYSQLKINVAKKRMKLSY